MNRDFDYENNNIAYDWQYTEVDGGGIKCKNYIICESVLPKWWFDCKKNYLCSNCHMMFGTWKRGDYLHLGKEFLEVTNNLECPICLEVKECISQSKCNHSLCISCFKRIYYGEDEKDKPIFPYPDIEDAYDDEYYDDAKNIKWKNYPLIEVYIEELNKWADANSEKYNQEENLRKCPLCRK